MMKALPVSQKDLEQRGMFVSGWSLSADAVNHHTFEDDLAKHVSHREIGRGEKHEPRFEWLVTEVI